MTDLGTVLGAILSGILNARRIADEETSAMAELYKDHPLLSGVSIPRLRIPEISIDIPMLVTAEEAGEADKVAEKEIIVGNVMTELTKAAEKEGVQLSSTDTAKFEALLKDRLSKITANTAIRSPRESVIRTAEEAFVSALRDQVVDKVGIEAARRVATDIRHGAASVAIERIGRAPALKTSVITTEVKDKATETTVSRIKLTLKEEGLEWSIGENDDGTITRKLTPE